MSYQSITTGIVRMTRISIPGESSGNSLRKYKASLLLPKSDVLTWQKIIGAISDAIGVALKTKWEGVFLENIKMPLIDGDGVSRDGYSYGEECKGHYIISAASRTKPDIVDKSLNPMIDPGEIYDGIYAYASLKFYPYLLDDGKPAIACVLEAVMKIADGNVISKDLTPAQRAFSGIIGTGNRQSIKTVVIKGAENNGLQPERINTDCFNTPNWTDENFQEMMESLKDKTLTLEELREVMGNAKLNE